MTAAPHSIQPATTILPCPFCGGEAVDRREIDGFPMIYCNGDDCFGPQTTASSFDDALVQWNKRAQPQGADTTGTPQPRQEYPKYSPEDPRSDTL